MAVRLHDHEACLEMRFCVNGNTRLWRNRRINCSIGAAGVDCKSSLVENCLLVFEYLVLQFISANTASDASLAHTDEGVLLARGFNANKAGAMFIIRNALKRNQKQTLSHILKLQTMAPNRRRTSFIHWGYRASVNFTVTEIFVPMMQ